MTAVAMIRLRCPRCGGRLEYESPADREFVSAYCLCRRTADPRAQGGSPERMDIVSVGDRELVLA